MTNRLRSDNIILLVNLDFGADSSWRGLGMGKEKIYELSEEKEYILSGTIDEIIAILKSDFSVSEDEARFITYISTIEKKEKIAFEEKELKLWYLNQTIPSTAPILKLPYTISITKFKLEMNHALYIFLGTLVLSKELGVVALSLDFIWALKEAVQKISEDEYCVYGRVVDFVHAAKRDSFEIKDIIPYDNDNECNRKPVHWDCPYWNSDRCSLTGEHIEKILESLVEKGVLDKVNQYWKMVK